jgi:uncharacterized repeat protein (TIGR03803 family)
MKSQQPFARCALLALVLAGCAHAPDATLPSVVGATTRVRDAATHPLHRVVYRFARPTAGRLPSSSLILTNGLLYGTTETGGKAPGSNGVVYSIDPSSGKESVVYNFAGGPDGVSPEAALFAYGGLLYGTTQSGGGGTGCNYNACGTVFSVDPRFRTEGVLHRFKGPDGANPEAALIAVNGLLYGTTSAGGIATASGLCSGGCGTVFTINPSSGAFHTLYKFAGSPDGSNPQAQLVNVGGTLYGTTVEGGDPTFCTNPGSCGTVFAIDPATGSERVVYSFSGGIDGARPESALTYARGRLYGTTAYGGSGGSCSDVECGNGTVYSVELSTGEERVVYRFAGPPDGATPKSGLLFKGGTLYGTTEEGGARGGEGSQTGTVYAIDASTRRETVLYKFPVSLAIQAQASRGENPQVGLVSVGQSLYGTTTFGGNYMCDSDFGCGTVFSINP